MIPRCGFPRRNCIVIQSVVLISLSHDLNWLSSIPLYITVLKIEGKLSIYKPRSVKYALSAFVCYQQLQICINESLIPNSEDINSVSALFGSIVAFGLLIIDIVRILALRMEATFWLPISSKFIIHRAYPWRGTNDIGLSILFFEVTRRTT